MPGPTARIGAIIGLAATLLPSALWAQDVPGIEICTVEKTMERRTSCLQSNVDFLQKTINKLNSDHQQKLDAASRQIESLKAAVAGLQKVVSDLQAAQAKTTDAKTTDKTAEDAKSKATPPAKEAQPAGKEPAK